MFLQILTPKSQLLLFLGYSLGNYIFLHNFETENIFFLIDAPPPPFPLEVVPYLNETI